MVNVAIIGFGGIAKAHLKPYLELEKQGKVKLKAICDICPERFEEKTKLNIGSFSADIRDDIKKYADWREMLEKEKPDVADVCLPTFLHADVTVAALEAGCNVLCEKPMSLNYDDCLRMIAAEKKSGKKLMIAQCLRFGGAYNYLKKVVDENTFGKVKSGVFKRLSAPPVWGWENWFMNYERSHGCLFDLHIHDLDVARYLFGEPCEVSCFAQDVEGYSGKDIVHSTLKYDGFSTLVVGDWSLEGGKFSAGYRVAFENAWVDYDNTAVTVYPRGGEPYRAEIDESDMYYKEIEFFAATVENGTENTVNTPESAARSIKLASTLLESSEQGGAFLRFEV